MKSDILGVKVDSITFDEALKKAELLINQKKPAQIVTVNPEFIVEAKKDLFFKNIINNADISTPDGIGLIFASNILKMPLKERITGVDLTWALLKLAEDKGYSVFFLGGKEGIAKEVVKRVQHIHPNLNIAGYHSGSPDELNTYEIIESTKPNILFVAFGAPKQEKFIYNLIHDESPIHISNFESLCIGVGGTFDYIAGKVKYAPKWMRKLGLEWLYRLFTQKNRFKRIFTAVFYFPYLVLKSKLLNG